MRTDSVYGDEEHSNLEQDGYGEDDAAEIPVGEDSKVKRERKFDLEYLLEQITPEKLHAEWDTGPRVGKEIW